MEGSPGSDIADCFDQALSIAFRIKATVVFDFNGVHCGVRPSDKRHPEAKTWFIRNYHGEMGKKEGLFKCCYANP